MPLHIHARLVAIRFHARLALARQLVFPASLAFLGVAQVFVFDVFVFLAYVFFVSVFSFLVRIYA